MQGRYRNISILTMFVLIITFPLLNGSLDFLKDIKNTENRALSKKPKINLKNLDPFPLAYEKYYNDNFNLRSYLIKFYNYFSLRVYNKSPFPEQVVIGHNDWLFLAGNELETYTGGNRLNKEQLEIIRKELESQRNQLAELGCKFYFMISPSKAVVYNENVPHTYYRTSRESIGQQLTDYLEKNSDIPVISLYEPFEELKKKYQIYYKHDNHWNKQGAFFASQVFSSRVAKDFNDVVPLSVDDFKVERINKDEGDIVRILGNPDFYEDSDFNFLSKMGMQEFVFDPINFATPFMHFRNSDAKNEHKFLLLSDSYSNLFIPFAGKNYKKTINVFDGWRYKLPLEIVKAEKPDIYLLLVHEPMLWNIITEGKVHL